MHEQGKQKLLENSGCLAVNMEVIPEVWRKQYAQNITMCSRHLKKFLTLKYDDRLAILIKCSEHHVLETFFQTDFEVFFVF